MRTTIVLDDDLLAEARAVLAGPSLRAIIEDSLRESIKARQRAALLDAIGNFDLAIDERDLEQMRRDRAPE